MKTEIVRGNDDLIAIADEWNRLWESSQCMSANARAETLVNFNQTFVPGARPTTLIVRDADGQIVAGLPLNVSNRSWIRSAELPCSDWSQCGRLLIAAKSDWTAITAALIDGIRKLRVSHLWMDWINIDNPGLKQLVTGARQAGWGVQLKARFVVGVTRLPESWEAYEQLFSKNSRRKLRTELKQMQQLGEVKLEAFSSVAKEGLKELVQDAIDIEMSSWKGTDGTAIGCDPAIAGYFQRWAETLNDARLLRIFFLTLNGQRIAFDLGAAVHGTYMAQKVSYLPEFARNSPGHVLNGLVNRHFIETGGAHTIDTIGPMNEANQRWSNDSYRCGRLVMAPGSWLGNTTGRSLVTLLNARANMRSSGEKTESVQNTKTGN